MKKVVVITTGGTIAMRKTEGSLAVYQDSAKMFSENLYVKAPELKDIVDISVHSYINVGSSDIFFNHIIGIRDLIYEYEKKGYDGVVITHGTDTMEQSSYLLDLITDVKVGVAFTGAQKEGSDPVYDGFRNVIDAIITVCNKDAYKQGAVIVFNGSIFLSREVTKTHCSSLDTFQSPIFGKAGIIGDDFNVYWYKYNSFREFYPVKSIDCKIEIVSVYMEGTDDILRFVYENGADGIIINSLGAGSIMSGSIPLIKEIIENNRYVVLVSRCGGRLLSNTYDDDNCTFKLSEMGVILGDNLTDIKARIKLAVLLSCTDKSIKIKDAFHQNFYNNM